MIAHQNALHGNCDVKDLRQPGLSFVDFTLSIEINRRRCNSNTTLVCIHSEDGGFSWPAGSRVVVEPANSNFFAREHCGRLGYTSLKSNIARHTPRNEFIF